MVMHENYYMNQNKLNQMKNKKISNILNETTLLKRTEHKSTYVKWFPKARLYFRNFQLKKNNQLEEKCKIIKMEV